MNNKNTIVNVGKQEEHTIAEVAKIIMDVMGIDPDKLEILPGPKGSAKRRCPDTSLMQQLTGFTKYTSLKDGLKITVESLL
jgi:nucleoside-diphosphate-sugar epimerase